AQIVGNPSETREAKEKKDEAKEPGSLAGLGDLCGEHGFANQPDMRPAPNAAAPLQDAKCIDALGRIETRMTELLGCMTELAGNLKDMAQTDVPKKKDGAKATTVPKAKAKKESIAPPSQANGVQSSIPE
ncbi:UVR8, partial [Symbiodinium pilosum]